MKRLHENAAPLGESGLNRMMWHGKNGMIVVSACRSSVDEPGGDRSLRPEFEEWARANGRTDAGAERDFLAWRNKRADKELRDELRKSGYSFTPVYGGYHDKEGALDDSYEKSYAVYAHGRGGTADRKEWGRLRRYAADLCGRYKQDSVYVQAPDSAPEYIGPDGKTVSARSSLDFKFNDDSQEFFTTARRQRTTRQDRTTGGLKTTPQKFTADISFESRGWMAEKAPGDQRSRREREDMGEVFLDEWD